jgi:hypothetical protein
VINLKTDWILEKGRGQIRKAKPGYMELGRCLYREPPVMVPTSELLVSGRRRENLEPA